MPRGIWLHPILVPSRWLAYLVYCGLTVTAFVCAAIYPSNVTFGLATDLLAGLIVVTFIDSLLRRAEELRVRPLRLAALKANDSVARCIVELIEDALLSVTLLDHVREILLHDLKSGNICGFMPHILAHLDEYGGSKIGPRLSYARQAHLIVDSVDVAIGAFGFVQEPEMLSLLARIRSAPILETMRRPSREERKNLAITPRQWKELLIPCDQLSNALHAAESSYPGIHFVSPSWHLYYRLERSIEEVSEG